MKRALTFIFILAFTLVITSCKGPNNSGINNEGFKEVIFALRASQNEEAGWTAMVDAANELLRPHKVTIKIQKIVAQDWNEYYTKLISQMVSRNGPSIGRIAESFIPQMIEMNQLAEITEYVNDLNLEDYHESAFEGVIKNGNKYYGMPSGIYHMLTFYNKDLIDKYNEGKQETEQITYPSKDWQNAGTFEYYRDVAKKLTSGSGANKTFGMSAAPYLSFSGMYASTLGGKNIFNEDGTSAVNSKEYKDVYKWFDDLLRVDYSMPRPTDTNITSAYDLFISGRVGMMVDGTWWLPSFKEIKEFNIGIATPPSGDASNPKSSQFVDAFFMLRTARDKEAAGLALKALMSKEAFIALARTGVGGIPIHKEAMNVFLDTLRESFTEEDLQCLVEGLDYTLSVPYTTFYERVDQEINQNMSDWLTGERTYEWFVNFIHNTLSDAIRNG